MNVEVDPWQPPLFSALGSDAPARAGGVSACEHRRRAAQARRVLVVDDDADYGDSLVVVLSTAHGADAEPARTAEVALDKVRRGCYVLAMIDVELPDPATGFALCEELSSLGLGLSIILMSARAEHRARAEGLGVRFFDKALDDLGALLASEWGAES